MENPQSPPGRQWNAEFIPQRHSDAQVPDHGQNHQSSQFPHPLSSRILSEGGLGRGVRPPLFRWGERGRAGPLRLCPRPVPPRLHPRTQVGSTRSTPIQSDSLGSTQISTWINHDYPGLPAPHGVSGTRSTFRSTVPTRRCSTMAKTANTARSPTPSLHEYLSEERGLGRGVQPPLFRWGERTREPVPCDFAPAQCPRLHPRKQVGLARIQSD